MNLKGIQEAKAERAALWAAAIEAAELRESMPDNEDFDRAVAWDDTWDHVSAAERDHEPEPLAPELDPYAAKLRRIRERLMAASTQRDWQAVYYDWSDMAGEDSGDLPPRRDRELAVYDEAARIRALLDQLERKYGRSRFADEDVESFVIDQIAEAHQTLAKLRRGRELELAKWDTVIDAFEGREALRKRNGRAWDESDHGSVLTELLTEE